MMRKREIPYYESYISEALLTHLLGKATSVKGVEGLHEVGTCSGLENTKSLQFTCDLYDAVKEDLHQLFESRTDDRTFIDRETARCFEENNGQKVAYTSSDYTTVIGMQDGNERIVVGAKDSSYCKGNGQDVAPIPDWLKPPHITLFGPPDSAKLAINAMNAFHRKLPQEPIVIEQLLSRSTSVPMWGADDEDSKTPTRIDLMKASENLTGCFDGSLRIEGEKKYTIAREKCSLPIKRIPGFALPCTFLLYNENPIPLHIYDFALHLYRLWDNPKALVFYIPKLENEEEARYLKKVIMTAEKMIKEIHPKYQIGTVRLMIVLENPRVIFRVNEVMDELYPYFLGASLGWHDYLASAARLFKEDSNYRIPVKSDPNIVVNYIKASHDLVAKVVGERGGVKLGGMYGVLPTSSELTSGSFQVSIKGFIKDIVTQLRRNLDGFWVAHPDFVRIGIALTQAWDEYQNGDKEPLEELIKALLLPQYHQEVLGFVWGKDVTGLDFTDPGFARSLLVADLAESDLIANNDEEEVRYNIFQSLQYITDWLSGNGCVALPANIEGNSVRVMDDLATAERSRWEVWHEIYHGRFSRKRLVEIAQQELEFIRNNSESDVKQVQVTWNGKTEKWYPVAFKLMLKMMTDRQPVEFATELMLPFTMEDIQDSADPWGAICRIDKQKYCLEDDMATSIDG